VKSGEWRVLGGEGASNDKRKGKNNKYFLSYHSMINQQGYYCNVTQALCKEDKLRKRYLRGLI
jgi:hypothetical protein